MTQAFRSYISDHMLTVFQHINSKMDFLSFFFTLVSLQWLSLFKPWRANILTNCKLLKKTTHLSFFQTLHKSLLVPQIPNLITYGLGSGGRLIINIYIYTYISFHDFNPGTQSWMLFYVFSNEPVIFNTIIILVKLVITIQ